VGLAVVAKAAPSSELDRFLFTDREALLLLPPDVIASWDVQHAEWSPDGRFVLASRTVARMPPQPMMAPEFRHSLILWNAEERASTELWKSAPRSEGQPQFGWLPAGGAAFAVVRQTPAAAAGQPPLPSREWLVRIDARRLTLRTLFEVRPETRLLTSPLDPLAVLTSGFERMLRVLRADGTVARQIPFPAGVTLHSPYWTPDGSRLVFTAIIEETKPGVNPESLQAFDPRTGELAPYTAPAAGTVRPAPGASGAELRLTRSEGVVQQGSIRRVISPLWLEAAAKAGEARTLVSADAEWGKLSPRGDAVMYRSNGAVWVAFLMRLPKDTFLQARGGALKQVAISNAKQLGLGVIIWAGKNNDTLPSADQPVWDLIQPIVKSEALGDGFVYTYPGGKLSDVAKPAETLLGYVIGPGGRAEIWVDGHVTWKAD
jgi:hypothetical protein